MNYKLHSTNAEQQELLDAGKVLPLMEDFYTIQGEGFNSGKAAYFIQNWWLRCGLPLVRRERKVGMPVFILWSQTKL